MQAAYLELLDGTAGPIKGSIDHAVADVLGHGESVLIVGLDRLRILEVTSISALINGLRKMRETGGTIRLVAGRPELARTLRITGLDHVFPVFGSREAAERGRPDPTPKVRRKRGGLRVAAAMLAFAGLFSAVPVSGGAQGETLDVATILAKLEERNPTLQSYQAKIHVDIHMTSFPFLAPKLDGDTYFKRPDNYEVVFQKVPSYAKGFDKIYADIGDPASWQKRFVITLAGEREINGRSVVALRMVQRVRGMIDHEDVLIDPATWTVDQMTYHYYNGGEISLSQTYREIGGYSVVSEQRARIAIPFIKALAHAVFTDYKANVALDDSVFTKGNHAQVR